MIQRFSSRTVIGILAFLFLVVGATFAKGTQETTTQAKQVLRIGQVGGIRSLEPYRNAAPNYLFLENVFDQLVFNEKGKGVYKPEAAVSWTLAPDNMSATVTLRKGMVTQAGSPVNAEMLKWDFDNRILQKTKGSAMYNQVSPYIKSVQVVNDLTAKFIFSQPTPQWKDIMALIAVADPKMFTKDNGQVALANQEDKQIASGPFKMVDYVPDSHMTLEKFKNYWEKGIPKLDRIEIRFFGDAASMMAALKAGEIDYAFNPPFQDAKQYMNNPKYTVWVPKTNGVAAILMVNPQSPQLENPKVREAIDYAINRDAINQAAYAGMGTPISTFTLPGTLGYNAQEKIPLSGDQAKAKELLKEAGSPNVSVKITYGSSSSVYRLICEVVAANLKAVGINATLDPVDQNVYIQKRTSQNFDIMPSLIAGINKYPAGLQDSFVFQVASDGSNAFFKKIKPQQAYLDYRAAFRKAMAATNRDDANKYFQQALLAVKKGAWVLSLVGDPLGLAISPSTLKGVTWTEANKPVFKYAYWEK